MSAISVPSPEDEQNELFYNRKKLFANNKESGSDVLYLAGFYKSFDNGSRSIILTTVANASVEKIHNRTPVILEKQLIDSWLSDEGVAEDYLKENMPTLLRKAFWIFAVSFK